MKMKAWHVWMAMKISIGNHISYLYIYPLFQRLLCRHYEKRQEHFRYNKYTLLGGVLIEATE